MTLAAIVCCREKDAEMLPVFVRQWKEIYPDVQLWLANDAADPAKYTYEMALTENVQWGQGVGGSIVRAMLATGADIVAKVDVDGWHRERYLFDPFSDPNVMAAGIAWSNEPGRFLGIGYAVRREALAALEMSNACCDWLGSQEDVAICHGVRRIWPNGVFLYPNKHCRRADTEPEMASVVHCGIHGRDSNARVLAFAEMEYLRQGRPVLRIGNEIWCSMSIMPDRLQSAKSVLTKLLNNRLPPTGIIVSLPHRLKRTGQYYDDEAIAEIANLDARIKIVRCDDLGPVTKYVELLRNVLTLSAICIIVDDDIDYSAQIIERTATALMASSAHVIANSTLLVKNGDYLIPEGWAGVAFQRKSIDFDNFISYLDYSSDCPDSHLADDAVVAFYLDYMRLIVAKSPNPVFALPNASNFDAHALNSISPGHVARYRKVLDWLRANRAILATAIDHQ